LPEVSGERAISSREAEGVWAGEWMAGISRRSWQIGALQKNAMDRLWALKSWISITFCNQPIKIIGYYYNR